MGLTTRRWIAFGGLTALAVSLLLVVFFFASPSGAAHVETTGANATAERSFEFRYVVHVAVPPNGSHTLRIWIPLPSTDAHQKIEDLNLASPAPYRIYRGKRFGNRFAYLHLNADHIRAPFALRLAFRVRRYEYSVPLPRSDPLPAREPFPPAVARYLLPDRLIPTGGIIGTLSRKETQGLSDPLAKARKLYEYVLDTMHYDHNGSGWGHGNAIYACTAHHGNCTDFHSLFIGLARAAGIPARFQIGFLLPDEEQSGSVASYHCWAEFYVQGIGWIPVDAAEAWLHPSMRNFYFSALDPNRVRFSRGRDIVLVPQQSGTPLNYFVYPYAELDGKRFSGLRYEFSFHDLALPTDPSREAKSPTSAQASAQTGGHSSTVLVKGKAIPSFHALDQFGKERDFADLRGPNGLVMLFFRSADW